MAVAILLLAACGQQSSIVVSLDAASVEVIRGAESQVEVTLSRVGATGEVELSVTGLPANVQATFSPAVLTGDTLTSTLRIGASAAATEAVHDLTVTATGPELTADAPLELQVVSLTVTGQFGAIVSMPVPGVSVSSQGQTVTTNADGEFELTGLSVPYDLVAWSDVDEWLHVYEGLTSSEVTLSSNVNTAAVVPRGTTISGSLTGGVIPVGPNQAVRVCVEGLETLALGCDVVSPTESDFSLSVQWSGASTREVRLHALQVKYDGTDLPVAYPGYASMELELKDAVPVLITDPLDLGEALDTKTVAVDIDSPATVSSTKGSVEFGPYLAMVLFIVGDGATAYDIDMPVIPDVSYGFVADFNFNQAGWVTGVTGESASVVIPEIPTLVTPTDLATGVTTETDFTATNPAGGPMTYVWLGDGGQSVALTSMATTVNIPDTSEYGFSLPSSTDFTWQVLGTSGDSVEDGSRMISEYYNLLLQVIGQSSPMFSQDGTNGVSAVRSFTTAP